MSKLLDDEELYSRLFNKYRLSGRDITDIVLLIKEQKIAYADMVSKYQTHIYKQDHPRLEAKGIEIWGVCIAYQGRGVIGDTAGSELEANTKLEYWLNYLKESEGEK
jgi:hypothetical protein